MAYNHPPLGAVIGRHISKLKPGPRVTAGHSRCDFKWRICRGVCLFRDLLRPTSRYLIDPHRTSTAVCERSRVLPRASIVGRLDPLRSFRRLLKVGGSHLMTYVTNDRQRYPPKSYSN